MPDRGRPRLAPLRLRVQLRSALRTVAAEGRGIVLYVNGHEGRGIGLVNKLRAYVEQDAGADTVDANLRLGLHADLRDYGDGAAILGSLGVRSVRLLSNNPGKAAGLRRTGSGSSRCSRCGVVPNRHNRGYLETKQARLGHLGRPGRAGRAPRRAGRRRHACSARCARAPTGPTSS